MFGGFQKFKALSCKHERLFDLLTRASSNIEIGTVKMVPGYKVVVIDGKKYLSGK